MYESGKRIPSAENIHKIANALNISIDEYLKKKAIEMNVTIQLLRIKQMIFY